MRNLSYVLHGKKKYYAHNGVLSLNSKGIKHISEIKRLQYLKSLKSLNLANNKISEIKGLSKLTNLKKLNLKNNQITEIKGLTKLSNLTKLNLRDNQLTEIKGLSKLTNLRALNLDNNKISKINGLESLINLKNLFVKNNPIPDKLLYKLGRVNMFGKAIFPQLFVNYCVRLKNKQEDLKKEKRRKKEVLEREKRRKREEMEREKRRREEDHIMRRIKNLLKVGIEQEKKNEYKIAFKFFKSALKIAFDLLDSPQNLKEIEDIKKKINTFYQKGIRLIIEQGNQLKKLKKLEESINTFKKGLYLANNMYKSESRNIEINNVSKLLNQAKRSKFKHTILHLGTLFPRLQVSEIAEVCGTYKYIVDSIVKEMIEKEQLHANFFQSTKAVVFNIPANVAKFNELMEAYKQWENIQVVDEKNDQKELILFEG